MKALEVISSLSKVCTHLRCTPGAFRSPPVQIIKLIAQALRGVRLTRAPQHLLKGFHHPVPAATKVSSLCWGPAAAGLMPPDHEAIDLTLTSEDEPESPAAAAAREAAQRQQIMAFARAKARSNAGLEPAAAAHQERDPPEPGLAANAAAQRQDPGAAAAAASAAFSNSDLRALHEARMQRLRAQSAAHGGNSNGSGSGSSEDDGDAAGAGRRRRRVPLSQQAGSTTQAVQPLLGQHGTAGNSSSTVSLLTYNVWFREDVAVKQRMQGIADIIAAAGYPTFICLQEMTPLIMRICSTMPWWQLYICSPAPAHDPYFTLLCVNKGAAPSVSVSDFEEVHYDNSCMGRSLKVVLATVGGRKLLLATAHLESPIPPHQWYSKERQQQMRFSLAQLNKAPYGNVLFAGDMNWEDSRDGQPPLPEGWADAWLSLNPGGADSGATYDAKNNPMLPYKSTPPLRLDRVFAKLSDYNLASIQIVGKEQLGDATYTHTFKSGGSKELPVLPSDHFGLLVTLEARRDS